MMCLYIGPVLRTLPFLNAHVVGMEIGSVGVGEEGVALLDKQKFGFRCVL